MKKHKDNKDLALAVERVGLDLTRFEAAVTGDLEAVKQIGELGRQGKLAAQLAPKLSEQYVNAIEGIVEYNRAIAEIYTAAGKGAISIEKGITQTDLESDKLQNGRKELRKNHQLARQAEKMRHQFQLNLAEARGYIEAQIVDIDRKATIQEIQSRPQLKQIQFDQDLEAKLREGYLKEGDRFAPIDSLIPRKNYGLINKVKSALGF